MGILFLPLLRLLKLKVNLSAAVERFSNLAE
jgi:hypothetical protein